MFRKAHPFRKF